MWFNFYFFFIFLISFLLLAADYFFEIFFALPQLRLFLAGIVLIYGGFSLLLFKDKFFLFLEKKRRLVSVVILLIHLIFIFLEWLLKGIFSFYLSWVFYFLMIPLVITYFYLFPVSFAVCWLAKKINIIKDRMGKFFGYLLFKIDKTGYQNIFLLVAFLTSGLVLVLSFGLNFYFHYNLFFSKINWFLILATIMSGCGFFYWKRKMIGELASNQDWPNKELGGKRYLIALILMMVLMIGLASYRRMTQYLSGDEFHIFNTANGLIKTGEWAQWNWLLDRTFRDYPDLWPNTLLLAANFKLFGVSELTARLPSLLAALVLLLVVYLFVKRYLASKPLALLAAFWVATNSFFVAYASYVRSYITIFLFALLFFYFFLKAFDLRAKKISFLNLLLAGSCFYLAKEIHNSFLLFVPSIVVWSLISLTVIYWVWVKKYWRELTVISSYLLIVFWYFYSFFQGKFLYLIHRPTFFLQLTEVSFINFPHELGLIILFLGTILALFLWRERPVIFGLFLMLWIGQGLLIYIVEPIFGAHIRYVGIFALLNYALIFWSLSMIFMLMGLKPKVAYSLIFLLIILLNVHLLVTPIIRYAGWNYESGYNYIDMYDNYNRWTVPGRRLPKYDRILKVLESKLVSEEKNLIIGNLSYESYYFRNLIEKYNLDYYEFCLKNNYQVGIPNVCSGLQLTKNDFIDFVAKRERGIVMFLTRKAYAVPEDIRRYLDESGKFTKLGGEGIDDINYDVYYWQ